MAATKSGPLAGFDQLADGIWLHRPTTYGKSHSSGAGRTIILCSWFRALPKHIAKYTGHYETTDESAQIILLTSQPREMLFTSHSQQRRRLATAISVIQQAKESGDEIFLHIFSNGGCNTAVHVAEAWEERNNSPLPVSGMAFDSCPGAPGLDLAARAAIKSFPASQWYFAVVFTWCIIVPIFAFPEMLGKRNLVEMMREKLIDTTLFAKTVPRLYLYSAADEMVPHAFVEDHAAAARGAGYDVIVVKFVKSGHVAHVNEDHEKYWEAVERIV